MKKYQKILALALGLLMAMPAMAQFRYGAVAGPTLTNLKFKQELAPTSQTPGFQAGVIGELMFPGIGFGIDLGLLYNLQGAKVYLGAKEIWASQGWGNERLMLHQLNIPFHLRFRWTRLNGFEDVMAPFVFGGPDFSILLAHGKCSAIDYAGGDVGLTAGVGVEIHRNWQISGSYTWGMTYALKTALLQNYSATTRQWTLRLTYYFRQ